MADIVHIFNPKLELDRLKYETVSMIRVSKEVVTMKSLITCYEILDITEQINRPWDSHPGKLYADLSALWELQERSRSMLIYQDPSADRITAYNTSVKRLVMFWKMAMSNGQGIIQF